MKAFSTSSKVFPLLSLSLLVLEPLLKLIKKLFIILADCFSFETRFRFSLRRSLLDFTPLLEKYFFDFGFTRQVHTKIPLLFIICRNIIYRLFVIDIFKFRSMHYCFSKCFSHERAVIKGKDFHLYWSMIMDNPRESALKTKIPKASCTF